MQISFTTNPIKHKVIDGILVVKPTRQNIDDLKIGDQAPNCFGRYGIVKEITYHGIDIHGQAYVGYYVGFGDNGTMSCSLKENEIPKQSKLSPNLSRRAK